MRDGPIRVLVICTGNSARSIITEALLRDLGAGRIEAFSAGTRPAGQVNPGALAVLARHGHGTSGLSSKDLSRFEAPEAPAMDIVLTVCDRAALEPCPVWPGRSLQAHWGVPDPAAVEGPPEAVDAAFEQAYATLRRRVERLLALPLEELAPASLKAALDAIGEDAPLPEGLGAGAAAEAGRGGA